MTEILNIPIEIEGIDKAGKDTIAPYIIINNNYAYTVNGRGLLTQLVYNDKFKRNNTYVLTYKPLIVFLDVENNDHTIRCKIANEPKINIDKDREAYKCYINYLKAQGFTILTFNTSRMTPIMVAEEVTKYISTINEKDFILNNPIHVSSLNFYTKEDLKDEDIFYEYKPE